MVDPELMIQLIDWMKSKRFGKYRGTVKDNADSLKRGRLQVQVPSVLGTTAAVWAEACVPYAGDQVGLFAMPPVGAGVWVEFEGGDVSYPIWSGCFWADNEAPLGGEPDVKVWKTDSITLTLDDSADSAKLENSSSASIEMTADVVTTASSGKHTVSSSSVTSEAGGSGKVEVTSSNVVFNGGSAQVS